MTKELPAIPMNKRRKMRPVRELTRPVMAVGMDAAIKTNPMGMRAPSLSVTAPRRKRQKISPVTATMLVVQISFLDNFKVFFMSKFAHPMLPRYADGHNMTHRS